MKIKLPKDIVGVKFPRICTIDMNDFDIDLFLPSLFFTILAQGRGKARRTNDPKAIAQFINALAQHPCAGYLGHPFAKLEDYSSSISFLSHCHHEEREMYLLRKSRAGKPM